MSLRNSWLLLLVGCDQLFGLQQIELPPSDLPLQEYTAQSASDGFGPPLEMTVRRTMSGSGLVLIAGILTGTKHIASITDNGGNSWMRVIDGPESNTPTPARLEIWIATDTSPTDQLTLDYNNETERRPTAVDFTEWAGIATVPLLGARVAPEVTTDGAALMAPSVETTQHALIIAAASFSSMTTMVTQQTTGFDQLLTSVGSHEISEVGAYTIADAGTFEVAWQLAMPETWSAGIVALRR